MGHKNRLSKASGIFFTSVFVVSPLRYLPFAALSGLANIAYVVLYFFAYLLWFIASRLYPNHPNIKERWYAFTEFKNQHALAALIGTLAVIFSVTSFFFPLAILPACWLFVLSNVIWLISEYHKKKNALIHDKEYSSSRQSAYMQYAAILTTMALITAIATTVTLVFPGTTLVIISVASVIGLFLTALAIQRWVTFCLMDHPPDKSNGSYCSMFSRNIFSKKKDYVIEVVTEQLPLRHNKENQQDSKSIKLKESNNEYDFKEPPRENSSPQYR